MFRNSIKSLRDVFETDVMPGAVILVAGPPGSMKSTFIYSVLSSYLENTGNYGIYMTLEQSKDSLLNHMKGLGIRVPENLYTYDYGSTREVLSDTAKNIDFISMIEQIVQINKERLGKSFDCLGLDSLNALYTLSKNMPDLRIKIFHFFKMLQNNGITSFIIMELPRYGQVAQGVGNEAFLADGIIEMSFLELKNTTKLCMQVMKMRGVKHSRDKFVIYPEKEGLMFAREVFE